MARRFRKIRYDEKKGQVTLIWEDGKAHEDKYSLECMESPRPEFVQAFKELAKHVAELCELPADYADRITTRSVSLNYGGVQETMGAVLSAVMELEQSNGVLVLNTPHKTVEMLTEKAEPNAKMLLTAECIETLEMLIDEAHEYVKGVRAQGDLFTPAVGESA